MSPIRLLLAAGAVLATAACTQLPWSSQSDPTSRPSPVSAPPAQPSAGALGLNTGGTYPYGGLPAAESGPVEGRPEDTAVTGPNGAIWLKPGISNQRYRADADDCYGYAHAQIAHDARIETDADAAIGSGTGNITSKELRQQMSQFARDRRLPRLFGECMEAKGYTRG